MDEPVQVERRPAHGGAIVVVRMNRPDARNAMNSAMLVRLLDVLDESARDDDVAGLLPAENVPPVPASSHRAALAARGGDGGKCDACQPELVRPALRDVGLGANRRTRVAGRRRARCEPSCGGPARRRGGRRSGRSPIRAAKGRGEGAAQESFVTVPVTLGAGLRDNGA